MAFLGAWKSRPVLVPGLQILQSYAVTAAATTVIAAATVERTFLPAQSLIQQQINYEDFSWTGMRLHSWRPLLDFWSI